MCGASAAVSLLSRSSHKGSNTNSFQVLDSPSARECMWPPTMDVEKLRCGNGEHLQRPTAELSTRQVQWKRRGKAADCPEAQVGRA